MLWTADERSEQARPFGEGGSSRTVRTPVRRCDRLMARGRDAPMVKIPAPSPEEEHFVLSSFAPTRAQTRLAFAVILVLIVASAIAAGPLSTLHPPRIDAFVPAYAMALFVIDLITATVLFAQSSILRSLALLALANGYLFAGLIVLPWMLTFPGVFTTGGLLGAALQTTNWLYILWHVGFPTFVLVYALVKDSSPRKGLWRRSPGFAILASTALTAAAVCAATFFVTAENALLPRTMLDPAHFSPVRLYIAGFQILWSAAVLIVLWVRRRSVLDLCLMVVMCAFAIEVFLIAFPVPVRFSMGWYAGRVYGLVSASLVLFVLLFEITILYAQLLRTVLAERREREARLITGDAIAPAIAHENFSDIGSPSGPRPMRASQGLARIEFSSSKSFRT
jgi:Membrane-associated sensor, integral membrane domain